MKSYHLIGIGGIGVGTLASLLLDKGYRVTGSDMKENDMIINLRAKGAAITIGHHAGNVKKVDFVVYSSAVRMTNPEMIEAVTRNIPILKRAEVLAQLCNEQYGIVVAGAHGKTTTSSMIASLLNQAQLEPTIAVGGIINTSGVSANLGKGKYFVAEVDESDGTFLYFRPKIAVITNIDFEHVDFYKNWEGIEEAYAKFISNCCDDGCIMAYGDDPRLRNLLTKTNKTRLTYGLQDNCDIVAKNIQHSGYESTAQIYVRGQFWGPLTLSVPGIHNVLNSLAVVACGLRLGLGFQVIADAIKNFRGVKRRFQLKGEVDGIMVVDDYGHHPTEINVVLKAARGFNRSRIVTVFQPHRYSRTKFLLKEFVDVLSQADHLILTDVYAASEKISEGVDTTALIEQLQPVMGNRLTYAKKDEINTTVLSMIRPGDMVLYLGAGDVYQLADDLLVKIAARHQAARTA